MRLLERSKDLTSFKCEIVSLLVSLNSFHLYLLTNLVNLSVFEYIYIYIHIWWWGVEDVSVPLSLHNNINRHPLSLTIESHANPFSICHYYLSILVHMEHHSHICTPTLLLKVLVLYVSPPITQLLYEPVYLGVITSFICSTI